MAHVVRVLKGEKTLRMHYANCRLVLHMDFNIFLIVLMFRALSNSVLNFVIVLTMLILMEMK